MAGNRYRCENEFGSDPCEAARGNQTFAEGELNPSMNGEGPKCPGKTVSGAVCGKPLVLIPGPPPGSWRNVALIGGTVLGVLALAGAALWWLLPGGGGEPRLVFAAEAVVFSQAASGGAAGTLRIRNEGEGPLEIEGMDFNPPTFTAVKPTESIPPGGSATLTIAYGPGLSSPIEGSLNLRTNDAASPKTVRLVVSADPWWVYERLESTSTTLSKQP
jgi:hypothetical protein